MTDRKRRKPSDFWDWDDFEELFERFMRDALRFFKDIEKEQEFYMRKAQPMFVSFRIVQDGKNPPRIEFSRGGPGIRPVEEVRPHKIEIKPAKMEKKPGVKYEEAPYTYNVDPSKVSIEINVEGVESEDNIEMDFGEESVEVKIYSPKTGKNYFAALPLPGEVNPDETEIKVEKDKVVIKIPRGYTIRQY